MWYTFIFLPLVFSPALQYPLYPIFPPYPTVHNFSPFCFPFTLVFLPLQYHHLPYFFPYPSVFNFSPFSSLLLSFFFPFHFPQPIITPIFPGPFPSFLHFPPFTGQRGAYTLSQPVYLRPCSKSISKYQNIYPLYIALGSVFVWNLSPSERMDRFEKFFFC